MPWKVFVLTRELENKIIVECTEKCLTRLVPKCDVKPGNFPNGGNILLHDRVLILEIEAPRPII